jgi:hypothetical protein
VCECELVCMLLRFKGAALCFNSDSFHHPSSYGELIVPGIFSYVLLLSHLTSFQEQLSGADSISLLFTTVRQKVHQY